MSNPQNNKSAPDSAHSTVTVIRTYKDSRARKRHDETTEDRLEVHKFVTKPASVRVAVGGTFNLGNFESLRYDVTVELPCYREEVEATYDEALAMCNERLQSEARSCRSFIEEARDQVQMPF